MYSISYAFAFFKFNVGFGEKCVKYFVVAVATFSFYPFLCAHTDPLSFQKHPFQ